MIERLRRGDWVRLGYSERTRFHRIVGFEPNSGRRLLTGGMDGDVRPIFACGKHSSMSAAEVVPWAFFAGPEARGPYNDPWHHKPTAEPPDDERCRACVTGPDTVRGHAAIGEAREAVSTPLGLLATVILIGGFLLVVTVVGLGVGELWSLAFP